MAYIAALMTGLTFMGIPVLGLKAPLLVLALLLPFIRNYPSRADFLPYLLPIPAFLVIIVVDQLRLVDRQERYSNRAFLAGVGGAVGGMTTMVLYAGALLTQSGSYDAAWKIFSLLSMMFSGAPAGMVLGAVMARSTVDRCHTASSRSKP